jgi:hypothetical protein
MQILFGIGHDLTQTKSLTVHREERSSLINNELQIASLRSQ